jgi:hypothetical protein
MPNHSLPRTVADPRRGNAGSSKADPTSSARKWKGDLAGPPVPAFLQGLPTPRSASRVVSRGSGVLREA